MSPFENPVVLDTRTPVSGERGESAVLSQRVQSLRLPRQAAAGGTAVQWVAWTLCLLLAVSTGVLGYLAWKWQPTQATSTAQAATPAKAAEETPAPTTAAMGAIALESKGYIIPAHQILVSPEVSGMIMELRVQEGDRVAEGDVLAKLEEKDYRHDRDRAAAMLEAAKQRWEELHKGYRDEEKEQAKADLEESQVQLTQLEADFKRASQLRHQGVISAEEFDTAESKYRAMQHHVTRLANAKTLIDIGAREERKAVARAEVQQAEAELAKTEWRLSKCTVRAPISGTILKKNAEKGNIVNPIAFNGSFSLCEMANLADLEVELTIQERDISRIYKGQKCKVRAEAFPDRIYEGSVLRLMPIADRAKGAVPVRVKVIVPAEEEGVYLKPEMGAIVSFLNDKSPAPSSQAQATPAHLAPTRPAPNP